MEIPRHWRLKKQRYNLEGFKITKKDGTVEYQFPPKRNPKILYDSRLLSPRNIPSFPDKQVINCIVINQDEN